MKGLVVNMFQHRGLEAVLCAAWRIFVGRPAGFFALGRAQILSLSFDAAKIQHLHCGLRIFHKKFSKIFCRTEKVDSPFCCSVAVLQFSSQPISGEIQSYIIYIYIYINIYNIEFLFGFRLVRFWTATLQHCNTRGVQKLFNYLIFSVQRAQFH